MSLADDEFLGSLEEMDFVANEADSRSERTDTRNGVEDAAFGAGIKEAKPSKDQRDAEPGEDDDLMDEFKGHGWGLAGCECDP
jgi:hypothetical protein